MANECLKPTDIQLSMLKEQRRGALATKIAIPSQNGISVIDLDEIIYAEASNNYAKLMLKEGKVITISKTLKDVQEILEGRHFLRVHRQFIVNLNHIKHFSRKDCVLTLNNKSELPVARSQSNRLMEGFDHL